MHSNDLQAIAARLTHEPCPECQATATCEHGIYVNGRPAHIWACEFCGELTGVVWHDCPTCDAARAANRREAALPEVRESPCLSPV